jgi:hypothetical protein
VNVFAGGALKEERAPPGTAFMHKKLLQISIN